MRIVMKFGGTSVGSGERMRHVAELAERYAKAGEEVVVVVSAMSGVTDALLSSAKKASAGKRTHLGDFVEELAARHTRAAKEAVHDSALQAEAQRTIDERVAELDKILAGIAHIGELTARSSDYILSFGERLSAPIVSGALRDLGRASVPLSGGEAGIVTDDAFGEAKPLMNVTAHQVRERLEPLLKAGTVPIVSGFIGVTQSGAPSTLGRGGSDFSASILGVVLRAQEIWVWKDVDGIMTADPGIVPTAKVIPAISFAEATEMAHFGAEIVHPRALELAGEHQVPFRVKNTFYPDRPGTLITAEVQVVPGSIVKAVSIIEDVGLITVSGARMIGSPRVTAKVLQVLAEEEIDVLMISQSSSEANISLAVPRDDLERAVNALELALLGSGLVKDITLEADLCIVATVGAGMKGTPGVAARVFAAMAQHRINIRTIAQGSSELNISFMVRRDQGPAALQVLHDDFQLGS